MSLQLLVILVPVLFAFMGFAFDLGRLYLIKGELSQAAASMALVSAQRLIGTSDSLDKATEAANQIVDDSTGHGAKYNFGALLIGQSNGLLSSDVTAPAFYATFEAATASSDGSINDQADGTTARHAQVTLKADAPLLFWSLLSLGQARSTPVTVQAVAGLSAPVCTACAIEPLAIPAQGVTDPSEDPNFGFTVGSKYTFAYQCTATGTTTSPAPLAGTGSVIPYLLIDRYTDSSDVDETQQLYRVGAQGLLPSTSIAKACVQIGASEVVWGTNGGTSGTPSSCSSPPPTLVQYLMCGLYTRFLSDLPTVCQNNVTGVEELVTLYQPDTDISSIDDYTAYTGTTRRVITVPIVEALGTEGMNVLGFRQFLLEPLAEDSPFNPNDQDGRFVVMYIGLNQTDNLTTPVPLKAGRLDGCQNGMTVTAGPGKVVLHQ